MSTTHLVAKSLIAGVMVSALAVAAHAKKPANPIKVNRSLAYFKESVGSSEIRKCAWNKHMIEEIADEANGRVEITDENLNKVQGRTLSLIVTSVQANGSDRVHAANWIHLRGELKEGQSVVATFTAKTEPSTTLGGKELTACEVLDKISKDLAEEIADWTKKPANKHLGYGSY
jgi:hypothetical protein